MAELFYGDPVDSLIILGDDDPAWLPDGYAWERSCSKKSFSFAPLKLLQWRSKEDQLFNSDNPFALFILAHLSVWATEGDDKARAERKLRLLLRGCSLKMSAEEEVDRPVLLRLIDWLLPLPRERNDPIWQQVRQLQEGQSVAFVSWFEQQFLDAEVQGEVKGLQRGIAALLKVRFGAEGEALAAEAQKQADPERLRRFLAQCETNSLDQLRQLLP